MNVQLDSQIVHHGFREVQVLKVLVRKASYRASAGRYKTHAVNVIIWDHVRQEERPVEFHVFGQSKENAGALGWLRWTDERMEIVRATAPKTVVVKIVPSRFNPATPFFHLSCQSRDEWRARIRNYTPAAAQEPEPAQIAQDSAVLVVQQSLLPGFSEELVVSR